MTPETILFVGDLHCGSRYGLWPEAELPSTSRYLGVRYLAECWRHMLDWLPQRIDLVILMGDIIEGKSRKAEGTGLMTADLSEQAEAAAAALASLRARTGRIWRVDGTPYHEDYHGALRLMDAILGVSLARQVIDVDLDGEVLNVAHHPAGGSALYLGTKLSKESIWSSVAMARRKVPHARWIVRGHLHRYAMQRDSSVTALLTPCWKLQDPYAAKGHYWDWKPDLGCVLMRRDGDEPGGYRMIEQLYDPPMPDVVKV
jgi:hypothetical protein